MSLMAIKWQFRECNGISPVIVAVGQDEDSLASGPITFDAPRLKGDLFECMYVDCVHTCMIPSPLKHLVESSVTWSHSPAIYFTKVDCIVLCWRGEVVLNC